MPVNFRKISKPSKFCFKEINKYLKILGRHNILEML